VAPGTAGCESVSAAAKQWEEHEELERIRAEMRARYGMTTDDTGRMNAFLDAFGLPDFPVTREELIARAHEQRAREAVVVDVRSLPEGARYGSMIDVLHALGVGGRTGMVDTPETEGRDLG
jgi:hypothetical protein